jgi:hypothetical protein
MKQRYVSLHAKESAMKEEQSKNLSELANKSRDLSYDWLDYWKDFSSFDTYGFWVNVAFLIVPLIVLYFALDRKRAFHLGFFGYSCHILSIYIDGVATRYGFWEYPFKAIPFLPISFSLDSSLIPVVYMLVYQWTIHKKKNYYLYITLTSIAFAFGLKPILSHFDLFELHRGTPYWHLFIWYVAGGVLSKWVTNVFLYFEKHAKR